MDCINDIDPITYETEKDILPCNIIYLTVSEKRKFYNIRALHAWVHIKPVDPVSKIHFNNNQLKKIRQTFEKYSVYENVSFDVEYFRVKNYMNMS
jgi:hypothetical protein